MERIMLISDDVVAYSNFINLLKGKYFVEDTVYIRTARYKLLEERYVLIIIEIRMATQGEFSFEETNDCAITGIIWFKKELAQLGTPVLFWSSDEDNEKFVDELKIKYPNNKIGFIQRDNFEEDHLLKGVQKFLNLEK